jgi:hypothetical protein
MQKFAFAIIIVLGGLAVTHQANAVVCANGVYRAGCTGPNGTAVVRKHFYHRGVNCAAGPIPHSRNGPVGLKSTHRLYPSTIFEPAERLPHEDIPIPSRGTGVNLTVTLGAFATRIRISLTQ